MYKRILLILLVLVLLPAFGCRKDEPVSEATPVPTETVASAPTETVTPAPTDTATPVPTDTPAPTPELITNEMLDAGTFDSYFDDAVFVGDSLTMTFSHYVRNVRRENAGFLGGARFLAATSMSVRRACRDEASTTGVSFQYQGKPVSVTEGLLKMGAKKAFFLFGLNDLRIKKWDEVAEYYDTLIEVMREKCPDTEIIIQAVLPVRKTFYDRTEPAWNSFNEILKEICERQDVTYLSFAEELMDENGELSADYCSDGECHLNIAGEEIWVRCLRRFAASRMRDDVVFEEP